VSAEGRNFMDLSARFLEREFMPRVRAAVERLDPEDLWWRPNEASNSIGNLLLHLAGNLRQWVVSGIGGAVDARVRHEEFESPEGPSGPELLDRLDAVVTEAARVLREEDPAALLEKHHVQGTEVTGLEAVYAERRW
jgi:uncharacterized damage-inducible protein DinB